MARKRWDDAAGQHVTVPPDPAELEFYARAVAEHPCRICNAKPGERCAYLADASKFMDRPHFTRLDDERARAAAEGSPYPPAVME